MANITRTKIYGCEEYQIYKYITEDFPFLSYVEYDNGTISYTREFTDLIFRYGRNKYNNTSISNIEKTPNEDLIKYIKQDFPKIQERYERELKNDEPSLAFIYHNKRDLSKQFYYLMINQEFSPESLYKYGKEVYSHIEDGTGYDLVFQSLALLKRTLGKFVEDNIREEIKDRIVEGDKVIVYRGFNKFSREDGFSYTFDKEVADFFAKRWHRKDEESGYVGTYEVEVKDIIAYIKREKEIITEHAIEIH